MSLNAAVPRITRSAPARSASRTAGSVRRPPPYCTARQGSCDLPEVPQRLFRLPGAVRAVEIDDVQEARARLHPRPRSGQRAVLVDFRSRSRPGRAARRCRRGCRSPGRGSPGDAGSGSAGPAARRPDAREVGEQAQAGRGGLLGWNCTPWKSEPLLHHGDERAPRRRFRAVLRAAPAPARTSARGRRRSAAAGRRRAASRVSRTHLVPADVRQLQPPASSARTSPEQHAEPLCPAHLGGALGSELHPEADAETGVPARTPSRTSSSSPSSRSLCIARGTPTRPGTTSPAAARKSVVVAAATKARAHVLERLLDRAAVAHAVVDDADPTAHGRQSPSASPVWPWRSRHARSRWPSGRSRPPRAARARTP